jgi:hypothetical protein
MSPIKEINWYVLIKRHPVLLLIKFFKVFFWFIIIWVIYYFSLKYLPQIKKVDSLNYISFWIIFILLNYIFTKIIIYIIEYYNDLIILHNDQIIILKSSLIMKDDMEVIDVDKVMKIDSFSRGPFQNIIWYGSIIIEQQKNDVRTFAYIPKPHTILWILWRQKKFYKK